MMRRITVHGPAVPRSRGQHASLITCAAVPVPNRRPATSPRLVAGLLYLQHAFDMSDEGVVWRWVENLYWQVFTGETYLQTEPPIDPSSLTRWRKLLGEAGMEGLPAISLMPASD